ncbi:MAG: SDR family NAD(P)-dependent oxidoreductase [Deinococcales bacterium]|jgi:NAD(P)-dependent dehydrogenase (short-subunit alcohol dehydrogenase family)
MFDLLDMHDQIAIVTGAGQGMGKATARMLSSLGATVIIAELNPHTGAATADELTHDGRQAHFVPLDVRDTASVQRLAEWVRGRFGRLDILVNNAGIVKNAATLETSDEDWLSVVDVNLNGVFRCCRELGRIMVEANAGSIVNMASNSAIIVDRPQIQPAYNASKAGVAQLTKSLAAEWAPFSVRVNAVAPGFIDTSMTEAGQSQGDWIKFWLQNTPLGRLGLPNEVAPVVVFLASKAASYMTGSVVLVDGGYCVW